MANNRMYLLCVLCTMAPATDLDDCRLYIAKYYPNTALHPASDERGSGWYQPVEDPAKVRERIADFLTRHSHGSMFGEDITLVYESVFGGFAKDKRDVLSVISAHLAKIQNGGNQ